MYNAHIHTAHRAEMRANQFQSFSALGRGEFRREANDDPPLRSTASPKAPSNTIVAIASLPVALLHLGSMVAIGHDSPQGIRPSLQFDDCGGIWVRVISRSNGGLAIWMIRHPAPQPWTLTKTNRHLVR